MKMARNIFSVVCGVVIAFIIVFIGDATAGKVAGTDTNQSDGGAVPGVVLVLTVIFWVLAAFFGGMVAARMNRLQWKQSAAITSALILAAALLILALTPHPTAMWIAALALYIPAGMLGGFFARRKQAGVSKVVA